MVDLFQSIVVLPRWTWSGLGALRVPGRATKLVRRDLLVRVHDARSRVYERMAVPEGEVA
jgi:hypothetical protein